MGPLSMNRNDLTGIPDTPKFGYSAVNKNYVDNQMVQKLTFQRQQHRLSKVEYKFLISIPGGIMDLI